MPRWVQAKPSSPAVTVCRVPPGEEQKLVRAVYETETNEQGTVNRAEAGCDG